jgi:hypothetical protein
VRRWTAFTLACLLLLFVTACGKSSSPTDGGVGVAVSVAVDHRMPSTTLDSSFAGLSYEKGALTIPLFSASNRALVALFRRFGPGVLRAGGNSVDETTWTPGGAGLVSGEIAPADVDRLAAFLSAAGWQVIYAVNMGTSTPTVAAEEASYARQALGDRLLGFEIGNEVDLYRGKYRPATYDYAAFRQEWESFATAIRTAVPDAVLTGPASASHVSTYTVPFAQDEAARIRLLTQHYYVGNGKDPSSTIDKLLQPDPPLIAELAVLADAAHSAHLAGGYRIAEANSYYNGGSPGVSDAYGSALWVIDFLFGLAAGGASGVNLHGGGDGPGYTPIANDTAGNIVAARPEYYGVLLFALAAQGRLVSATVTGPAINFSAYAIDRNDGSTAVVLVNKDGAQGLRVTVDVGRPLTSAQETMLTGPALESTTGVQLGGAPVESDGGWSGAATSLLVNGTGTRIDVPPISAVLVEAR